MSNINNLMARCAALEDSIESLTAQLEQARAELRGCEGLREKLSELEKIDMESTLDSIARFLPNNEYLTWRQVLAKYDRAEAAEAKNAELTQELAQLRANSKG